MASSNGSSGMPDDPRAQQRSADVTNGDAPSGEAPLAALLFALRHIGTSLEEDRDRGADARDRAFYERDRAFDARDRASDARDERAAAREHAIGGADPDAVADRARSLRDRQAGANDRAQTADDRRAAASDRSASAMERVALCIDSLTGAHRREAGLVELKREIARTKRAEQPLTLAFVDVVGLKAVNDSLGHAAGDKLLRKTVDSITTRLRSYDLIIRFGGDEFVCVLPGVTTAQAAERFKLVSADLAATQAAITVGLAELQPDDAPEDLVARADEAMYGKRQERQ